jgi:hypothetical protein
VGADKTRAYYGKKPKKPAANLSLQPALPLRHIGIIVIWEGNYNPDIFNIGENFENLNKNVKTSNF